MRRGLVPRMLGASLLLGAVVVLAFALVVNAARNLVAAGHEADRAAAVSARANHLEKLILDVETGQRGFLLARRRQFLQPWSGAVPQVAPEAERLVASVTGDPPQHALAVRIRSGVLSYLHDYSEPTVARARAGRVGPASLVAVTSDGKRRVDALRALFGRFLEREQAVSAAHERAAASEGSKAIWIAVGSLVVSFLLVLAFTGWLARAIVVPLRRVADATARLAAGDLGVRVPARSHDELGVLGRAFNGMAGSLQESRDELESQNAELEAQQAELERAVDELAEGKLQIESLHALGARMTEETDVERLAAIVLDHFTVLTRSAVGTLYAAVEGPELALVASSGLAAGAVPARLAPAAGLPGRALRERGAIAASFADTALSLESFGVPVPARHELQVPLFHAGAPVAVIGLGRTDDRPFGPWEVEEIEHRADQAAVALANALSLRRAVHLADVNTAVLDATQDAIRLVDPQGRPLVSNRAMRELMGGVDAGDELPQPERVARLAAATTDPDAFVAAMSTFFSEPSASSVYEATLAPDGRRLVFITAPVRDSAGDVMGRILTIRDVTAEREAERLKDEFLATVTHELRTPLTSIVGYLELVLDGEAGEVTDDQRRFLGVVERSADRLLNLVGDLLFVAQSEAGRFALERDRLELGALVRDAVEAARPLAEERRIELSLRARAVPAVDGDRVRLAQVVDNLLSNAVKFTPEGGSVEVTVGAEAGTAVVEVADSGIGIPEAELPRLFDRFFRASTATRHEIQGTGLGLAIAKTIVEAHGGRLEVRSVEDAGTTFRVVVPASRELAEAA